MLSGIPSPLFTLESLVKSEASNNIFAFSTPLLEKEWNRPTSSTNLKFLNDFFNNENDSLDSLIMTTSSFKPFTAKIFKFDLFLSIGVKSNLNPFKDIT